MTQPVGVAGPGPELVHGRPRVSPVDPPSSSTVDFLARSTMDDGVTGTGDTTGPTDVDDPGGDVGPEVRTITDDQAVTTARSALYATPAGYGLHPPGDGNRPYAHQVRPTPGYVTLDVQGSPGGFVIGESRLTPAQFAVTLWELVYRGDVSLPPGHGLRLISAETAVGGAGSPAATLARALGVAVLAPDSVVWTAIDGEEIVSSPDPDDPFLPALPPDGRWHRVTPDGRDIPQ